MDFDVSSLGFLGFFGIYRFKVVLSILFVFLGFSQRNEIYKSELE